MEDIFFIKLFLSIFSVLGLSLVVDHAGPRIAGVLSGYPLGAAITLFFYGMEIGERFAADSAVYTLAGLLATEFFVFAYYKTSVRIKRYRILSCSTVALAVYFFVAWLIHFIPLNRFLAALIPISSIFVFSRLFQSIANDALEKKVPMTPAILVFRAVFSAAFILIITGGARWAGERWAGLFSAFPVTLFPLILIVDITYGIRPVHTVIKNFPIGLGSLIVYCLTVSVLYPVLGIYSGTALAFAAATLYLVVYGVFASSRIEKKGKSTNQDQAG